MEDCLPDMPYLFNKATNLLNTDTYKNIPQKSNEWTED